MTNSFSSFAIVLITNVGTLSACVIHHRAALKIIKLTTCSAKISNIPIMFLNSFKFFFGDYNTIKHTHCFRLGTIVKVRRYAEVWRRFCGASSRKREKLGLIVRSWRGDALKVEKGKLKSLYPHKSQN